MRATLGILLVATALAAGCSKPERVEPAPDAAVHLDDDWWRLRASDLHVTVEQAQARDAALAEDRPPEGGVDRTTALEAATVWSRLCAQCHGTDGAPPETLPGGDTSVRRRWGTFGTRMGFFFGGDKMRAGIYRTIRHGGEVKEGVPSKMPAWGRVLSREQTWGLVRQIESF